MLVLNIVYDTFSITSIFMRDESYAELSDRRI
jgi:hypothetical protein